MLISIGHVIRYTYGEPSNYAIASLRLVPPSFDGQRVVGWSLTAPGIELSRPYRDGFGNVAHCTTVISPHSDLVIIAKGVVDVRDCAGVVKGLTEWAPRLVFHRVTPATAPSDDIRQLVAQSRAKPEISGLHKLMQAVSSAVALDDKPQPCHESASDALDAKSGNRADIAHVFISAVRVLGLPARFVTGYLVAEAEGPADAQHCWAEVWVDGLGWVGFDPLHLISPTDRYVRLAVGLDAASAPASRVWRQGNAKEELDVIVEVQQQSVQQ